MTGRGPKPATRRIERFQHARVAIPTRSDDPRGDEVAYPMNDLLSEFLAEADDTLTRLEVDLETFEERPHDQRLLSGIFRSIHTIKGMCGFLELDRLERVAHAAEGVLGRVRDGEVDADPRLIQSIVEALDAMRTIVRALEETGGEPAIDNAALIHRLDGWLVAEGGASRSPGPVTFHAPVAALRTLTDRSGDLLATNGESFDLTSDEFGEVFRRPRRRRSRPAGERREPAIGARERPIRDAWRRLPRLIAELAENSGKRVALRTSGGDLRVDHSIVSRMTDPFLHMARNSVDHGIESPGHRRSTGKPETATISIEARQENGCLVLDMSDDGRGLDMGAIRRMAVSRGLVTANVAASLSDAEVGRFVLEPGITTARRVTNVSGRGVGMDVVRTNVESIGGTVEIATVAGTGTTIIVRIPLTAATP